ncbi:hypothetical protein J6590_016397 [Homalodisca vitripennis]|nr:hypothetical protein J6590_016397 [Homalodisca vitripennis]
MSSKGDVVKDRSRTRPTFVLLGEQWMMDTLRIEIEDRPILMEVDTLREEIDSTRFLRIYFDRGLTWNDHVDGVVLGLRQKCEVVLFRPQIACLIAKLDLT